MEKKLVRPTKGRILFGVCAGLGEYFNIDPTVIRIIFVILAIWGGAGIILYIIGFFLMPEEKEAAVPKKNQSFSRRVESVAKEVKKTAQDNTKKMRSEQIFGLVILLIGLIFLFQNFMPWFSFGRIWPIILIALGAIFIASAARNE